MKITDWLDLTVHPLSVEAADKALQRQANLTKPPGSLGQLESIVVQLAAMQSLELPSCERVSICIFAADHGVAQQGVSAFPQEVTAQMILNFASGGAAISVLARQLNADFEVVNLGTVSPVEHEAVIDSVIAQSTTDFTKAEAMTAAQLESALNVGAEAVARAQNQQADLFVAGEMGIANTTSASALIAALLNLNGAEVAGSGTGINEKGVRHKAEVIDRALALHADILSSPLEILRCLGGFEISAMVGAYLMAAHKGIGIVVDGFISTIAAYIAVKINAESLQWMFFAHRSSEQFHQHLLDALQVTPLLDLEMRLGEGSGAAIAIPLLRSSCELHRNMATFSDAGVSES
ncbi:MULTISPECIES: nicotinate-nucleotide--dimethylbenzimidazole phosphoribosyltransferase [unclassified Neptuniibacter]|uniref:nicotinate-nucleotide--dimethylbenzimidazole phosphoribosyltransferase n=1 Tax=unclassified Neptuniibacter TaxID=2630693 RepID=UPI000C654828|nr:MULTISPECIES: nicotinate-nucleotide--dimethylbenzimidazole phosphoribosyltransferase [unclassified Neptuniibacter]MAY42309.1 nicotinate-nucleotide--dimethylbenzimidazole phosphoribosyltransferase [Oceanospirillaceae bacterium]